MKRKIFLFALFILASSFIFSMSKRNNTITGLVHIYGNAPFTYVGFVTDDGKEYAVDISKDSEVTVEYLKSMQGTKLELTGKIEKPSGFNDLHDGRFVVVTAEEAENSKNK